MILVGIDIDKAPFYVVTTDAQNIDCPRPLTRLRSNLCDITKDCSPSAAERIGWGCTKDQGISLRLLRNQTQE